MELVRVPPSNSSVDRSSLLRCATSFVGSDFFCFKACDPAGANDDKYCEHIYDRIGCNYNMPNQAKEGSLTLLFPRARFLNLTQ